MTFLGATALLLSSCGSEEYSMPAADAVSTLASLGYSPVLATMPAALGNVQVSFESMPDGQSVQWSFRRGRDDLGRIVATVEPTGDSSSKVAVNYVEGSDRNGGTSGRIRKQLQVNVRPLFVEAVDSTLDRRPFDETVRAEVDAALTEAMGPTLTSGIDASLEAEIERRDKRDAGRSSRPADRREAPSPAAAAKPTTDLSRFN
jgi:hypothetical protein